MSVEATEKKLVSQTDSKKVLLKAVEKALMRDSC